MRKVIVLILILVFAAFYQTTAFADEPVATAPRTVTAIYPNSENFAFELSGSKIIPEATCTNRFKIELIHDAYSSCVAAVMTAFTTGKTVIVWYHYDSALGECSAVADRIKVLK